MKSYTYKISFIFLLVFSLNIFSQQKEFDMQGVWYVTDYKMPGISAMDKSTANEWLGKKAIIGEDLSFEYEKIKHYSSVFKNNPCKISLKNELVKTDEYLSGYKINPVDLGLNQPEIRIIRLGCKGTPFDEVIIKSKDEIIIVWDGVFFFLNRK